MATYKEIVTKAVIGKGKKVYSDKYTITPEINPTTVLGCWVINHNFKGYPNSGKIVIDGDTKTNVINKKINYSVCEAVRTRSDSSITDDTEVIVRSLKQPTCSNASIVDGNIEFTIDKELGIEIIGDTKAKILVEDDDDEWDILSEDVDTQIDKEVNEEYISDKN